MKAAFLAAFNQRIDERDVIFAAYDEVLAELTDTTALDAETAALSQEQEVVTALIRRGVEENARAALDQDEYNARRDALEARFKAAEARLAELDTERGQRRMKQANITRFLKILKKQDVLVTEFEEELWYKRSYVVGESGFEPLKSLTADLQLQEQMYKPSPPNNLLAKAV